jgi:hypothetical protein
MSLFETESSSEKKPKKIKPFYRVYTIGDDGDELDHDPDCVVEDIAVGNQAHYVVKKPDGTIDGMYPFTSVECVWRVTETEDEEE